MPHWPVADLMAVDHSRLHGGGLAMMIFLAVVVVGPPSFLIGMTFAFVQRAVQQDLASVGTRVGWVQLANIAGNAAGSIFHWPDHAAFSGHGGHAGIAGGTFAVAAAGLALAWGLAAACRRQPCHCLRTRAFAYAGQCRALVAHAHMRKGRAIWWPGREDRSGVAFFRDSKGADGVAEGPFFIQGFSQGRIPFLSIHQFLGAVGPLIHPEPKNVLVIGIGSGGTPWAAGIRPESQVRAIELVAPVLTALEEIGQHYPDGPIARMFKDPRWQMEYGDGRRTLAKEDRRYDIIEAMRFCLEGSHSGLLYSAEFIDQARRRLAPGGLYIQWTPTQRAVETFAAVFPHALLLMPAGVMIGSNDPIPFDPARLAEQFARPAIWRICAPATRISAIGRACSPARLCNGYRARSAKKRL
jgi:hypothetical protein